MDDPSDDIRQLFAEMESKRTGKPTFAEVMRQTVHGPPVLDGPRFAALSSFLQSVVGTPFERPIWDEYHRRKWLDDATLTAAVGIAKAEGLDDPECSGLWEVWSGFLLPKLERFAGTIPGWNARNKSEQTEKDSPRTDTDKLALFEAQQTGLKGTSVAAFCRKFIEEHPGCGTTQKALEVMLGRYRNQWEKQ
jgi:hypothetical protein